jgi:hypothetical protein
MNRLRAIYNRLPARFRRAMDPVADYVQHLLHLRVELWSVTGVECHGGLPLSILCGIPDREKRYVLKLIFGSDFRETKVGSVWWWKLHTEAEKLRPNHSMIAVQVRKSQFAAMRKSGYFTIPSWVQGSVNLPIDPKVLRSRSVQSDFKKIRELSLEFEVTRQPEHLQTFYHQMYVPYMQLAHGATAYIESCAELRNAFRDWEILLIKKGGEWIAGKFIGYGDGGPTLYRVGVRNGDRQYIKERVVSCVYQFSFQYLTARGFTNAQLAWSRAFLNDGVLRYKQKLSQSITGTSVSGLALKIFSEDEATRSFLRNNPFIGETAEGLCGFVFVDGDKPLDEAAVRQLNKDYFHPGLVKLSTHLFPPVEPEHGMPDEVSKDKEEGKCGTPMLS